MQISLMRVLNYMETYQFGSGQICSYHFSSGYHLPFRLFNIESFHSDFFMTVLWCEYLFCIFFCPQTYVKTVPHGKLQFLQNFECTKCCRLTITDSNWFEIFLWWKSCKLFKKQCIPCSLGNIDDKYAWKLVLFLKNWCSTLNSKFKSSIIANVYFSHTYTPQQSRHHTFIDKNSFMSHSNSYNSPSWLLDIQWLVSDNNSELVVNNHQESI